MRDVKPRYDGYFEKFVKDLLNRSFSHPDFFVLSEIAKFKPLADEEIWRQAKGLKPEICEVYYKTVWLCDVYSFMRKDEIVDKVNKFLIKFNEKPNISATAK